MNIQIFGKSKCFDTKKAERYFKERGVKYQLIDMTQKGMSKGEFQSVASAVGGCEHLIDWKAKDQKTVMLLKYLAKEDVFEKLFENQQVMLTPVVRSGKLATVGFCQDTWKNWN